MTHSSGNHKPQHFSFCSHVLICGFKLLILKLLWFICVLFDVVSRTKNKLVDVFYFKPQIGEWKVCTGLGFGDFHPSLLSVCLC